MASTIADGQIYAVMNIASKTVLDLDDGKGGNNVNVSGWDPAFPTAAQNRLWKFERHGDFWKLFNYKSGTALTMQNGASGNGTPVVGSESFDSDRQLWRFALNSVSKKPPFFRITNKESGTVVDLNDGGSGNGTKIQGWDNNTNTRNQEWVLVSITP
ncbi:hypothetical protein CkaCkLH20_08889 [Colletotrichum karsti]|uniref:Ricin B lectin domain-containing protein n=1 Tax=Colletotrichum karsti TaxID=1095194 RepID=A0A9P6LF45_9PEZI|nr:uncharacterized protein CkaCkLH20_08889 [Colletotrichum karsti]KAF9873779.1 hypothetical protein CkaCkLH20_08889 [Colletotrichum karsti]